MSDPADWPRIRRPMRPTIQPPRRQTRRPRGLILILLALILVAVGSRTWLSYYVESLWFQSLGYSQVFWKTVSLQSTTFLFFSFATFLILYGIFLIFKRTYLGSLPSSHTVFVGGQPVK